MMIKGWPRIVSRESSKISPWVEIIARDVEFADGAPPETYHSVKTPDYVIVLAVTLDRRIPLVRQYRPAIECFTLELPAGMLDGAESAADTAARELLEETGYPAKTVTPLGTNASDSGRLSNRVHSFFIEAGEPDSMFKAESGIATQLVTPSELTNLVLDGSFGVEMQLGVLLRASLRGFIKL
jgi:ADP-ribose pyrophosphatase